MRPDLPVLLALLAAVPCLAQEPIPLDLPTAMTLAARHSPDVRIARERVNEQQGVVVEVQAVRRPRVDAAADYQMIDKDRNETFGDFPQNEESYTAQVTASQTVYAGGSRQANAAAAEKTLASAREEVRAALSGVLLEVGTYYYDSLLARRRALAQEEAIAVYNKQRDWASRRFQAGAGPELDVLRAEVAIANAKPPLIRARNDEKIALERLVEAIGFAPARKLPTPFALEEKWGAGLPAEKLEYYETAALSQRAELQATRLRALAAVDLVRASRGAALPEVNVFANYGAQGRRFQEDFGSPLHGWGLGASAKWALFDSGLTRGREAQAESRRLQLELELEKLDMEITRQVHEAWLSCQESAEIRSSADTVIRQAAEVLRQAEVRLEAGAATQLDVLEAQWELTRAKLERVQADYGANVSLLRLQLAAGLLGAP